MSDREPHCPFLNRADPRCSESFRLDGLEHALEYCFGDFPHCRTYQELLAERRVRRSEAASMPPPSAEKHADRGVIQVQKVQVRIARGNKPAGAAAVPAVPRV